MGRKERSCGRPLERKSTGKSAAAPQTIAVCAPSIAPPPPPRRHMIRIPTPGGLAGLSKWPAQALTPLKGQRKPRPTRQTGQRREKTFLPTRCADGQGARDPSHAPHPACVVCREAQSQTAAEGPPHTWANGHPSPDDQGPMRQWGWRKEHLPPGWVGVYVGTTTPDTSAEGAPRPP